jgi:AcrR family transcriptional regulator
VSSERYVNYAPREAFGLPNSQANKQEKIDAVAGATAELLWKHGIEAVTHARLARAAGVSRAWLYKYIGSKQKDLLRFTTVHFGDTLGKFHNRPRTDGKDHWITDTVEGVFALMQQGAQHPWVLPLYFRYIGTQTELGRCIADIEQRYLATASVEIRKVFGLPPRKARWAAELLLALRSSIAYRHAVTGFVDQTQMDDLRALLTRWSESL